MAISPSRECYITSSADAVIAKHPFPWAKGIWSTELKPVKISQTKHAGQQGLRIRSDGRIFVTAGWDARIRVYSMKTLKELAVLRWHKAGCFATALAQIGAETLAEAEPDLGSTAHADDAETLSVIKPNKSVQQKRAEKAQTAHWLAAGSKDGKISLWDIY